MGGIGRSTTALLVAAAGLALSVGTASAGTTVTNVDAWDGVTRLQPWGRGGTATYGQVITATALTNILNSFEFQVNSIGSPIHFLAQVLAWDSAGNHAVGNPLYSSVPLALQTTSLQTVHIGTGAVGLSSGQDYVLLLTTNGVAQPSGTGTADWGWVMDHVTHGIGVWNNHTGVDANTRTWDGPWVNGSWAFSATFNSAFDTTLSGAVVAAAVAVPGPIAGAGLPVILGVAGLTAWRRRKAGVPA